MIKENRASKYILYAIGEIALVVIGILIALSINNWTTRTLSFLLIFYCKPAKNTLFTI